MSNRIASDNPETSLQNQLLNAIAGGAERESMRFMAFCADRLVLYCNKPMLVECEIRDLNPECGWP